MQAAGPHRESVPLVVKPGATVRSVLAELDTRGALADRRAINLLLRVRGWPKVKVGPLRNSGTGQPRGKSFKQLEDKRVVLKALTIVEGWTFADMRRAMKAHPNHPARRCAARAQPKSWLQSITRASIPEGRFYPGYLPIRGRYPPIAIC